LRSARGSKPCQDSSNSQARCRAFYSGTSSVNGVVTRSTSQSHRLLPEKWRTPRVNIFVVAVQCSSLTACIFCKPRKQCVPWLTCFSSGSSWTRHSNRCSKGLKGPTRKKACQQCTVAKTRCNLERPICGTCRERRITCKYILPDAQPAAKRSESSRRPPVGDGQRRGSTVATPNLHISEQRREELLVSTPSPPELNAGTQHTMHFIIRVLKSWPRMMAAHDLAVLPPMIHNVQLEHGMPTPLANCSTLAKMWAEHVEGSSQLVRGSIAQEVQRLFREVWKKPT
jgi:hypothetical protein